jgi:hypothetical protein
VWEQSEAVTFTPYRIGGSIPHDSTMKRLFALLLLCSLIGCQKKPEFDTLPPPPIMAQPQVQSSPLPTTPDPVTPPPPVVQDVTGTYQGTWVTTNVPLNGTMKCVVTGSDEKWKGTFSGVWHGRPFSYNVAWSGPPSGMTGKAVIDGARYEWKGSIVDGLFKGSYTGNRYTGSFELRK